VERSVRHILFSGGFILFANLIARKVMNQAGVNVNRYGSVAARHKRMLRERQLAAPAASGPGVPTAKKSRREEDRRASCYGSAQNGFDL